jgi:hypothetical protein
VPDGTVAVGAACRGAAQAAATRSRAASGAKVRKERLILSPPETSFMRYAVVST